MTTVEHMPRASEVRTFLLADIRGLDARNGQRTGPTIALPDTATWIAPSGSEVWLGTYRSSDATRSLINVHLSDRS